MALAKKDFGGKLPNDGNYSVIYRSGNAGLVNEYIELQNEWAAVGININVTTTPLNNWLTLVTNHYTPFLDLQWGDDYDDPQDFTENLLTSTSPYNTAYFHNAQFDKLNAEADVLPNGPDRTKLYVERAKDRDPECGVYYDRSGVYARTAGSRTSTWPLRCHPRRFPASNSGQSGDWTNVSWGQLVPSATLSVSLPAVRSAVRASARRGTPESSSRHDSAQRSSLSQSEGCVVVLESQSTIRGFLTFVRACLPSGAREPGGSRSAFGRHTESTYPQAPRRGALYRAFREFANTVSIAGEAYPYLFNGLTHPYP